jgi:hypothetical protein
MHPEADDLRRVPLFADLTDAERARVAAWFQIPGARRGRSHRP